MSITSYRRPFAYFSSLSSLRFYSSVSVLDIHVIEVFRCGESQLRRRSRMFISLTLFACTQSSKEIEGVSADFTGSVTFHSESPHSTLCRTVAHTLCVAAPPLYQGHARDPSLARNPETRSRPLYRLGFFYPEGLVLSKHAKSSANRERILLLKSKLGSCF